MGVFVFLTILIVNTQPISLLKLSPQTSETNKQLSQGPEDIPTQTSSYYQARYSQEKKDTTTPGGGGLPSEEISEFELKTNSSNSADNIHDVDPNENGGARGNNDDKDDGRQFSDRIKTAGPTTSSDLLLLPSLSTNVRKASHERHARSLKNDTHPTKVGSEKNHDHQHHHPEHRLTGGEGENMEEKNVGAETQAAIENFQKAFVNGDDISVSEAEAFAGMDMGILEKFGKGKSQGKEGERSEDKKSIQKEEELSSELEEEDGNNDIKMQDLKHLTNMKGKKKNDIAPLLGPTLVGAVRVVADDEEAGGEQVAFNRKLERGTTEEEFDESVEGAPEGIDSIENSSVFYHSSSFNSNNFHEHHRRLLNQSSRLTFAGSADFDNVGSGSSGGGDSIGGGGSSRFEHQSSAASTSSADEVKLYRLVQRLLQESPLIDGHNDLPWNLRKFLHGQLLEFDFNSDLMSTFPWSKTAWSHTDLPRLRRGLVGAQFWVAYAPCESQNMNAVQITLEQIDLIRRLIARYPDQMVLALSADDIERAHKSGKIASLIAVEGGHSIGNSLATLRSFYELGVRYMTLTHNCNTPWADSARPGQKPEHGGLTDFGRTVVREMNRLGMLVDLSHTSKLTMKDALKISKAPVIFSHSSAYALCNSSRNVPDDILNELVWNGGIIMVTFYNIFVKCHEQATIRDVADHINYIKGKIGIRHIGVGSDFDGINLVPTGLEDTSKFPNLFVELARSPSWSNKELQMVAGINFLRVFREAENLRDAMHSAGTSASFENPPRDIGEDGRCRLNTTSATSSIH